MSWSVDIELRLGDFELKVACAGGRVAVIGRNGSGKSALLRTVAGAHRALGRVVIEQVVADSAAGIWRPPEARRVGYLPQGYGLFPHLDVLENVRFAGCAEAVALDTLARLGAAELAARRVHGLSGGEQQRVALARALCAEPRLLLLDEPLAALDVDARRAARHALQRILRDGDLPALIVTHDARDVLALADSVVVLEAGRVVQSGPVAAVRADPASAFVAAFFE